MKKRMISSIALGLVGTSLCPIMAGATGEVQAVEKMTAKETDDKNIVDKGELIKRDWAKDFPKLINPKKDEIKTINYSAETMIALKELMSKVDELEKTYGKNNTKQYMEVFEELFKLHNKISDEDRNLFNSNDQFSYIFYKLNYMVFTEYYDKEEEFNQFYQDLSDIAYFHTVELYNTLPKSMFIHFLFEYLDNMTIETEPYFKDKKTNAVVQIAYGNIKRLATGGGGRPNNPNDPSDDMPYEKPSEGYNPDDPGIDPDLPPEEKPDTGELPKPPEVPDYGDGDGEYPSDSTYTESEYVYKNGICYYVETIKDFNGNVLKVKETKLSSEEGFFCGIVDNLDFTDVPWDSSDEMFYGEKALDVFNSLAENELNELSNFTLQFSLNKKDSKPYYFDSGIRVSNNKTVSFTQLRDVLNQIAIKSGGYLIDDKDKILFIAEGKPLVVKEKKTEYSEEEVSILLNSFENIDLKVREKGESSIEIDEELINNENTQSITVNNEKVELSAKPRLESSILQLPVKDVAEALGYKVEITDKVATITKNSTVIEIEIGTKTVKINGREKVTATASSMVNGTLFAEMNIVAQESGLKIYFDKTKGSIEIK